MIETERLLLRAWDAIDLEAFAAMNADPVVMEHFAKLLSREESDAVVARLNSEILEVGHGFWATEVKATGQLIGFIGIRIPAGLEAPFMPAHEIGWRLTPTAWGRGYATEGARASLRYGFDTLRLEEIVSFTSVHNLRSRAVMERLAMTRDPNDDFDHPNVPDGSPHRRHVLYRLARPQHLKSHSR